jgi:hypothetical protein
VPASISQPNLIPAWLGSPRVLVRSARKAFDHMRAGRTARIHGRSAIPGSVDHLAPSAQRTAQTTNTAATRTIVAPIIRDHRPSLLFFSSSFFFSSAESFGPKSLLKACANISKMRRSACTANFGFYDTPQRPFRTLQGSLHLDIQTLLRQVSCDKLQNNFSRQTLKSATHLPARMCNLCTGTFNSPDTGGQNSDDPRLSRTQPGTTRRTPASLSRLRACREPVAAERPNRDQATAYFPRFQPFATYAIFRSILWETPPGNLTTLTSHANA